MAHAMLERFLHWFLERVGVPFWVLWALAGAVGLVWAFVDWMQHRRRVEVLRKLVFERKGNLVRGWRFWSPVARIGTLEASVSPMRLRVAAPSAGRLWLDSRDIPDRRVKARRGERVKTGDWAFDDAFDGCASSRAFGEACLDGDVRGDLLKLDALARRSAPEADDGKPQHRLRVDLDGRRLEMRFRHALDVEDIPGAVDLLERLAQRLVPLRP